MEVDSSLYNETVVSICYVAHACYFKEKNMV